MTIDRHKLQAIIEATKAGEPLDDEQRAYTVHLLTMVNQLAFDGDDLERIYRLRQKKAGERIGRTMNDMQLLGIAQKAGRGMNEAWRVIRAKREGVHKLPALVEFVIAVEGVTPYRAYRTVSEATGMSLDTVKRKHLVYKADKKATAKG